MTQNAITLLCPGQGAQSIGMGRPWFEGSAGARALFERADEVLGGRLPLPLSQACFQGPDDVLGRTDVSQPALFVTAVASFVGSAFAGRPIEAAAGLSLGEYSALHLAGAITFEEGLELVALRGRAMQDAAEATDSSMVALIGATEDQAAEVCEGARGSGVLVCANFNAPGQVVLSGERDACQRAVTLATDSGLRATELKVAGAFHSPLMQPAADRLADALASVSIRPPECPVLSNVTGEPHAADADSIRARLVEQLTSPVRWTANVRWLAANTAHAEPVELAPGKTLSGLARRIDKAYKLSSVPQPDATAEGSSVS